MLGSGYDEIPTAFQFAARVATIVTGVNIAVSLASGVFGGIVVGVQRQDLSNVIEVLNTLFRMIAIIAVHHGKGLIALAIVQLSFAILTGVAYVVMAVRLYPHFRIDFSECDKEHLKLICSFSVYSFLLQAFFISDFLYRFSCHQCFSSGQRSDVLCDCGQSDKLFPRSAHGISTAVTPMASALEAKLHAEELNRVLLKGTRYATMVFLPIWYQLPD